MRVDKLKWTSCTLDSVCDIQFGTRIVKKQTEAGQYYVYGGGGATFTTKSYNRENAITVSRFALSKECTRFIEGKFFLNDSGLTLHPKTNLLFFQFLKWHTFALNDKIYSLARGAAQKNLDVKQFSKLIIKWPKPNEQCTIAAELDALQEMIDGYKAQIADLDALAQSIFLDMFGDPVANPKGWEMHAISSFGKIVTGNTPPKAIKEYYDTNYIEWIKTDNIQKNNLPPTLASEYLSEKGSLRGRVVSENSILICCIAGSLNSIGRCCITNRRVAFNQQINAIECNNQHNFLYSYWLIKCAQKKFIEAASTGMKHILSKSVMSSIKLPVSPIPLQQHFASQVKAIEKQKELLRQQLADAETLMAERMQYYFS